MSDESGPLTAMIAGASAIAGAALTGVLTMLTGKPQGLAAQQQVLNSSFAQFMETANKEITELKQRISADEQYINSLVEILRRHDIEVPRRPPAEVVFLVQPTRIKGVG